MIIRTFVSLVHKMRQFLCEIKLDLLFFLPLFVNVIVNKLSLRKQHCEVAETGCMDSTPSAVSLLFHFNVVEHIEASASI